MCIRNILPSPLLCICTDFSLQQVSLAVSACLEGKLMFLVTLQSFLCCFWCCMYGCTCPTCLWRFRASLAPLCMILHFYLVSLACLSDFGSFWCIFSRSQLDRISLHVFACARCIQVVPGPKSSLSMHNPAPPAGKSGTSDPFAGVLELSAPLCDHVCMFSMPGLRLCPSDLSRHDVVLPVGMFGGFESVRLILTISCMSSSIRVFCCTERMATMTKTQPHLQCIQWQLDSDHHHHSHCRWSRQGKSGNRYYRFLFHLYVFYFTGIQRALQHKRRCNVCCNATVRNIAMALALQQKNIAKCVAVPHHGGTSTLQLPVFMLCSFLVCTLIVSTVSAHQHEPSYWWCTLTHHVALYNNHA